MVFSPISGKKSKLVSKIDTEKLIKDYYEQLKIDITPIISKECQISLYEDNESGYRFFHPFQISGDDGFYQNLEKFDWYYMPWKWEHEISLNYIKKGHKVLEVGCGSGGFIKNVSKKLGKENIVGLELNSDAVNHLQEEGYLVYCDDLLDFTKKNREEYDLVCSYQVLEHIANVKDFISAQIKCLKKGGKLIISVPNNNSTLFCNNYGGILNHPPHHLGHWNKESLSSLEEIFQLKLKNIHYEPIQDYHWDWYLSVLDQRFKSRIYGFLNHRIPFVKKAIHRILYRFRPFIKGHTIVAVYEK
jgi:2-polyprenyl-3-methyl-5-hydroxy-6-metoxy-1,4-benzoquinol methylase